MSQKIESPPEVHANDDDKIFDMNRPLDGFSEVIKEEKVQKK